MSERDCPYCGEQCVGVTILNSQEACCGFGCEHCCEVERDDKTETSVVDSQEKQP